MLHLPFYENSVASAIRSVPRHENRTESGCLENPNSE